MSKALSASVSCRTIEREENEKTATGFLTAAALLCACGSVTDGDVNAMEVMKEKHFSLFCRKL